MAFGAAEAMTLPELLGQQEGEEQERKRRPKHKSQSQAVPQRCPSQRQPICASHSPLNQPLTLD